MLHPIEESEMVDDALDGLDFLALLPGVIGSSYKHDSSVRGLFIDGRLVTIRGRVAFV
jgi:UDP-N-acetylenolpyruvoylglucosamine reductase